MKKKGFTLIELLVVIAIIAILAGIVIIAVNPARQMAQARNAQRRADVLTDLNAVYQFYLDNSNFPPGIDTTIKQIGTGTAEQCAVVLECGDEDPTACVNLTSSLAPTYIAAIPYDPCGTDCNLGTTGYAIKKVVIGTPPNTTTRITVKACRTEIPPATAIIEVTR